jgi:ABC-type phosphate transport system auxiliary subunit
MKREIAELFAEVERLNEKVHEMLAERDDAIHKMFNGEISEKELKAMNKACSEASKAWKQAANSALRARLHARREAAAKWGFGPNDQFILMGDMRGRISSHRTIDDAIKAANRDRETCRHLCTGAYSDVLVYQIDLAGELYAVNEHAYENQKE